MSKMSTFKSIKRHDFGRRVILASQELTQLGYLTKSYRFFGGPVEKGVKDFQRDHKLPVTGEVDIETWAHIVAALHRIHVKIREVENA